MSEATAANAEGWNSTVEILFPSASFEEQYRFYAGSLPCAIVRVDVTKTDREGGSYSQSVAICRATERFPQFSLVPKEGVGYMFELVGLPTVTFPNERQFPAAYSVFGMRPAPIQALFHPRLISELLASPGWCVDTRDNCIALYRRHQVCPRDTLASFADSAGNLLRAFLEGAKLAQPALHVKADAHEDAETWKGLYSSQARAALVTRSEVEVFVQSATPRKLTAAMLASLETKKNLALFGLLFSLPGAAFVTMFALQVIDSGGTHGWQIAALGLVFLAIGGPLAFFAGRSHFRSLRVLSRGVLASAKIDSLETTGMVINDQAVTAMAVSFAAQGLMQHIRFNICGDAGLRAQRLLDADKPASILYDPDVPSRALYVDSLITESADYDP